MCHKNTKPLVQVLIVKLKLVIGKLLFLFSIVFCQYSSRPFVQTCKFVAKLIYLTSLVPGFSTFLNIGSKVINQLYISQKTCYLSTPTNQHKSLRLLNKSTLLPITIQS